MSDDMVDDLHYAEDLIGAYQVRSAALLGAWDAVAGTLAQHQLLNWHSSLVDALVAMRKAEQGVADLVADPYCRLSCGHRNWLETDGQEGETITDGDEDCQDQYCGCPCHAREMLLEGRWVPQTD